MSSWILKAMLGAGAVVLIQALALSKNFFLAGLVPLFPTFALISHYLVGTQRAVGDLKETILFGMGSLVPYFLYLGALYMLVERFRLPVALAVATAVWTVSAVALVVLWGRS